MGTPPVTQALWLQIMGENPAVHPDPRCPIENVSWKQVTARPYLGPATERRLRGGCHHNWDLHCRVWWRYGIEPGAHDGCIGFRVVLAQGRVSPGIGAPVRGRRE
jgi:formylglycine-generating enzyme required for sulfatase activity